jgi:hypothetical protein
MTLASFKGVADCEISQITHCETYSGRIWKDFVHQCKVLDISSVFSMKIPQNAHIDNVFFCQNPVENCTQIFLRFDVDRDKSDVMMFFGMIDWSDICRVFQQTGSSLIKLLSRCRKIVNKNWEIGKAQI